MTLAACLAFYGFVVAIVAPRLLPQLTAAGANPRLGVAVWTSAVGSVLASWVGAAAVASLSVVEWSGSAAALLHSCLAALRPLGMFQPWVAAAFLALAAVSLAWLMWLGWRIGSHWYRAHRRGLLHARAVRLAGRAAPQLGAGTVVVESEQVTAYCVASRSRTVVVTRGALDRLDPAELEAVLAHEHAHLVGRHHLLLTLLGAVRRAFPGVTLFRTAEEESGRLLEMRADDIAVERHGPVPLVGALATMTEGATPSGALAATGHSVLARALRLAEPPSQAHRATSRAALSGTAAGLLFGPGAALVAMALSVCPVAFQ
ncbi:M56 family metallopeptidase [Saccharopolyspora griseoalba]|uniref:M56 family metallopeptidase n=1 Tax=Saccharopolyspora griseoalba TaxID=1431848 RepID=A0ABW2LFV7_9PSEU